MLLHNTDTLRCSLLSSTFLCLFLLNSTQFGCFFFADFLLLSLSLFAGSAFLSHSLLVCCTLLGRLFLPYCAFFSCSLLRSGTLGSQHLFSGLPLSSKLLLHDFTLDGQLLRLSLTLGNKSLLVCSTLCSHLFLLGNTLSNKFLLLCCILAHLVLFLLSLHCSQLLVSHRAIDNLFLNFRVIILRRKVILTGGIVNERILRSFKLQRPTCIAFGSLNGKAQLAFIFCGLLRCFALSRHLRFTLFLESALAHLSSKTLALPHGEPPPVFFVNGRLALSLFARRLFLLQPLFALALKSQLALALAHLLLAFSAFALHADNHALALCNFVLLLNQLQTRTLAPHFLLRALLIKIARGGLLRGGLRGRFSGRWRGRRGGCCRFSSRPRGMHRCRLGGICTFLRIIKGDGIARLIGHVAE